MKHTRRRGIFASKMTLLELLDTPIGLGTTTFTAGGVAVFLVQRAVHWWRQRTSGKRDEAQFAADQLWHAINAQKIQLETEGKRYDQLQHAHGELQKTNEELLVQHQKLAHEREAVSEGNRALRRMFEAASVDPEALMERLMALTSATEHGRERGQQLALALEEQSARLIKEMGAEVCRLMGVDESKIEKKIGRSEKYFWAEMIGLLFDRVGIRMRSHIRTLTVHAEHPPRIARELLETKIDPKLIRPLARVLQAHHDSRVDLLMSMGALLDPLEPPALSAGEPPR